MYADRVDHQSQIDCANAVAENKDNHVFTGVDPEVVKLMLYSGAMRMIEELEKKNWKIMRY